MEVIPGYNRDAVVRCLTRHYETLVQMGYMEDSNILRAPPGGWDDTNIDAKSFRIMGRNETVIDLLRHLPYLKKVYEVMPETTPMKYLGQRWDDTLTDKMAESKSLLNLMLMPFDTPPEPGMICLTSGRDGTWCLIDTQDGSLYPYGAGWDVERPEEDPPWLWYNPVAIEKYFDGLRRQFLSLELIPLPHVIHMERRGFPDELEHKIFKAGEYDVRPVKLIFQDHGWPNVEIFRKDDCIKAANIARLQQMKKSTFRWYEADIKRAEASGDVEEKEKSERKLREAQMEYEREWGQDA